MKSSTSSSEPNADWWEAMVWRKRYEQMAEIAAEALFLADYHTDGKLETVDALTSRFEKIEAAAEGEVR